VAVASLLAFLVEDPWGCGATYSGPGASSEVLVHVEVRGDVKVTVNATMSVTKEREKESLRKTRLWRLALLWIARQGR
jgi:hypothetical protein